MEHSFVSICTNKRTSAQAFIQSAVPVAVAERGYELGLLKECVPKEADGCWITTRMQKV